MRDIMVDLETLGTVPGCAILSIGAVAFDMETGKLGGEFYAVVHLPSCEEIFLEIDKDTEKWWEIQTPEARRVLEEAADEKKSIPVKLALERFNIFVKCHAGRDARVWGNGSDFDNAILASAYRAAKLKPSWKFWNNRCYRTVKSMSDITILREGTYHNALDDARSQAVHLLLIRGNGEYKLD